MKTLFISSERTEQVYDTAGSHNLYPEGTERVIRRRRWWLFGPWQEITQIASIEFVCGIDGCVHFNKWETTKTV